MTRKLKAVLGFILAPIVICYCYAVLCYREDEWPWQNVEP
jgi:hypothetical protein